MLRPTLARLLYSSVFIVIPLILQHSIEFRFPRETPPAHIHVSVLRILLLLVQLLAPIFWYFILLQ